MIDIKDRFSGSQEKKKGKSHKIMQIVSVDDDDDDDDDGDDDSQAKHIPLVVSSSSLV